MFVKVNIRIEKVGLKTFIVGGVVLSHKISTPPARLLAGRIEVLFRSTVHSVKCKQHSRIPQRTLLVCFLLARNPNINTL
ncbi:hypothetical protein PHJA_000522100 [Phtheirospermum japonicum]|uniref:Uncharacterized protein n=1 Tax=Phtheirospermum japonicum TaxID=374723 RepID=A0A830B9T4_9LAMI|nr:hypothetical protein PHJA_000522100 [Phtheirospermum japonicum]